MTLKYVSSEKKVCYKNRNKCNFLEVEAKIEEIKFTFLRDSLFGLPFPMCFEGFWWDLYSISEKNAESSRLKKSAKEVIFSIF